MCHNYVKIKEQASGLKEIKVEFGSKVLPSSRFPWWFEKVTTITFFKLEFTTMCFELLYSNRLLLPKFLNFIKVLVVLTQPNEFVSIIFQFLSCLDESCISWLLQLRRAAWIKPAWWVRGKMRCCTGRSHLWLQQLRSAIAGPMIAVIPSGHCSYEIRLFPPFIDYVGSRPALLGPMGETRLVCSREHALLYR